MFVADLRRGSAHVKSEKVRGGGQGKSKGSECEGLLPEVSAASCKRLCLCQAPRQKQLLHDEQVHDVVPEHRSKAERTKRNSPACIFIFILLAFAEAAVAHIERVHAAALQTDQRHGPILQLFEGTVQMPHQRQRLTGWILTISYRSDKQHSVTRPLTSKLHT